MRIQARISSPVLRRVSSLTGRPFGGGENWPSRWWPSGVLLAAGGALLLGAAGFPMSGQAQDGGSVLAPFREAEAKFSVRLTVPEFPGTAAAVESKVDEIIAHFTGTGDTIAAVPAGEVTFENAILPFDRLHAHAWDELSPIEIVENTSVDAGLREAATQHLQRFREFEVGFSFRDDIYETVAAYAATEPELEGERQRLYDEVMRDYRRRGFGLPEARRDRVEALQTALSKLETDFQTNVRETASTITFTRAQLEGLPDQILAQDGIKTGEDEFTLPANIAAYFIQVLDNAKLEETRRRMLASRSDHAKEANVPLLTQVVSLRTELANVLGYRTWADYQTEPRMAGSEKTVRDFLYDLNERLAPKVVAEIEELRKLKADDTGDPEARIESWDVRYYQNQLLKTKYAIDTEALRVFFPYENTLEGMFDVYEQIFGITIGPVDNPDPWAPGVTLHAITDTASGEPLGLFYLDMFPRPGKYNHFAQFGIIAGRQEPDGPYQRPTVALICNFPPPGNDRPSLLSLDEVETLFHEFGHCLHSIFTRAQFAHFSGTSVPRDFVEAPSQVLEYWVYRKEVLDLFAADYRDPSKKVPADVLKNLETSKRATIGLHYKRQLGYGLTDLNLHAFHAPEQVNDVAALGNKVMANTYFPQPENTAFVAGFGHLMGYDAGYYGYAWADVISADLAAVFEQNDAFLDPELGLKLRREIFEPGHSRPIDESIRAFLGRERSFDAFVKKLGISN